MAKKIRGKVISITVKEVMEDYPDLSWLGEFSDVEGEYSIKHDGGSREYKFFNAANVMNREQAEENYNRMMQFSNGTVYMVGIIAEAVIHIPINTIPKGSVIIQHVISGGLWGIESDSDESYKTEIKNEQIAELKGYLKVLCCEGIEQAEIIYKDN